MKILMVHPNWKAYSEVWLHRMIQYLEDDIVGIACFSPLQKKWNNKIDCFDLYGKKKGWLIRKLFRFDILKPLISPSIEEEFISFVRRKKPDIIFINFIGPALYLRKALDELNLPVFIHVHGVDIFWEAKDELTSAEIHPNDYKRSVQDLAKSSFGVRFIANSKLSIKRLQDIKIQDQKIFLKHYGVPVSPINKIFRKGTMKVLFLGRFVDFKGPDIVVGAFIKASESGFDGVLEMYGSGPLKVTCELVAKRSRYANRITFGGPVSSTKALELFRQADIFTMHNCEGILSKQDETFGVTIIEAMANAVPVVTGASGGPEEIITDQHDGILIKPGDVTAHANAFIYLQNNIDFLETISRNCVLTIRERFSEQQEKKRLVEILSDF